MADGVAMMLAYYRTGGRGTPPDGEAFTLAADAAISGWRGVAPTIGSFEGVLDGNELAAAKDALSAVSGVDVPTGPRPPGTPSEVITIDDGEPVEVSHLRDDDGGPWDALAALARGLLDRLTAFPKAALALSLDGTTARLTHVGTGSLVVDLGTAEAGVTRWRGYFEPAGNCVESISGPSHETVGPGWSYELPLGDAAAAGADITVHVTLNFAIVAGASIVPVRVSHAPMPATVAPQ